MAAVNRTLWLAIALLMSVSADAQEKASADIDFFESKIRPILVEHCHSCHSGNSRILRGNLRLDRPGDILKGGDLGPAIVPGKPEESLLIRVLTHRDDDLKMPLDRPKLPEDVIADFETWIAAGAAWPAGEHATEKSEGFDLAARKRELPWIWQTPARTAVPAVRNTEWPRNFVDRFLLNRLEAAELVPAADAAANLWLRRVSFSLTGLPPTPDELDDFLGDTSPTARERVVDRLLASPAFGERWGRHWLDLMRYAESRGHESDFIIPNAYEYRDYVVRALNADLPYDEFVREHVAGDLVRSPRRNPATGGNESIIATGWAFLGEEIHAPVDTRLDETERIDNRIDVLTKTFLGLTVSCARCHDHKFDALSQQDYYALAGFFISSGQRLARFETMEQEREIALQLDVLHADWQPRLQSALRQTQLELVTRIPQYLSAAAQLLKTSGLPMPEAGKTIRAADFSPEITPAIETAASTAGLNPGILKSWTAALWNAVHDRHDVLHAAARVAVGQPVPREPPSESSAMLGLAEGTRVVVDFGNVPGGFWPTDGVAFGLHAAQAGALQTYLAPESRPALRTISITSATTDPDWRRLDLAPGVEREPTLYKDWKRDGVLLRSPKFELHSGRLHYLVRGSGRVFASVDSQRLLTGPIHTGLLREWGFNDQWHWVSHDLTQYAGHRVAIEFSPGNEFDTAVALIVEAETPPAEPLSAGRFVAQAATLSGAADLDSLASLLQQLFEAAIRSPERPDARRGSLEIARWLTRHPEFFSGLDETWPETVAKPLAEYRQLRDALLNRVPWASRTTPAFLDGNGVDEYLLVRGKHQRTRGLVPRRFLEAVSGPAPITGSEGSGRLHLAHALTDPSNPLLARVLVNRVWHHLFGRGIVASVDNFGVLGARPTHPELLDHLAVVFVSEDNWSIKQLIRRLVLTHAFAQSSDPADAQTEQLDPENLLLHRMNLKRLEGEAIRDAILSVSGRLDRALSGVSIPLHPTQFVEARGLRSERGPLDGDGRRSLYVSARRNFLPMMMTAFDTPTPFTTVGRRSVSNVPGQMLFLMNDPFVHEQAGVWARRALAEATPPSSPARVRFLFRAAFSREPTEQELNRCLETLRQSAETLGAEASTPLEAWAELCHALLAVKEFLFVR